MQNLARRSFYIAGGLVILLALCLCGLRLGCAWFSPELSWVLSKVPIPKPLDVTAQRLTVHWIGLKPSLRLQGLTLQGDQNPDTLPLYFEQVDVHLALWASITHQKWIVSRFDVKGTHLTLEESSPGTYHLKGLERWPLSRPFSQSSSQWPHFFQQLSVVEGTLDVCLFEQPKWKIKDFRFWLDNQTQAKVRGKGTLAHLETPTHFSFGADFKDHNRPEEKLDGVFYLYGYGVPLNKLGTWLKGVPVPTFTRGVAELQLWTTLEDLQLKTLRIRLNAQDLNVHHANDDMGFKHIKGDVVFEKHQTKWQISGKGIQAIPQVQMGHTSSSPPLAFWMTFDEAASPFQEGVEVWAKQIQFGLWRPFLSHILPAQYMAQWVVPFEPKGKIEYAYLNTSKGVQRTSLKLKFSQLGIAATDDFPGFDHLAGTVIVHEGLGYGHFYSKRLPVFHPKTKREPYVLKGVNGAFEVNYLPDSMVFKIQQAQAKLNATTFNGKMKLQWAPDTPPFLHLLLGWDRLSCPSIKENLPIGVLPKGLTTWLDQALEEGEAAYSTLLLRGPLDAFPFKKNEGVFEVYSQFKDLKLKYSMHWPTIENLAPLMAFSNHHVHVYAEHGELYQSKIKGLEVRVLDYTDPNPRVIVDGKIHSTLSKGFEVIQKSPLQHTLGKTLSPIDAQGPMTLSLALDIPLGKEKLPKVGVRGFLDIKNTDLNVPKWGLDIQALQGELSFTEFSVISEHLEGKLFNQPTEFILDSNLKYQDPRVNLKAKGNIHLEDLTSWLKVDGLDFMRGKSDYQASLHMARDPESEEGHLKVNTNLVGVKIDAPAPFGKKSQDSRALDFDLYFEPNESIRIVSRYQDEYQANFKVVKSQNRWEALGGEVLLGPRGMVQPQEANELLIHGEMDTINLGDWQDFFERVLPQKGGRTQKLLVPRLDLEISKMVISGVAFEQFHLKAAYEPPKWALDFQGPTLQGKGWVPDTLEEPAVFRFSKFKAAVDPKSETTLESPSLSRPLRPIDFMAKAFESKGYQFKDFELTLSPDEKGYLIKRFIINGPSFEFNAQGQWAFKEKDPWVNLQGKLLTQDFGETLKVFGYPSSIHDAPGRLNFKLWWDGHLGALNTSTLRGQSDLNLKKGYIQGVDLGLGRLLSLLDIDSLQRRLQFDFSDITKDGFVFDSLESSVVFSKGTMSTRQLEIDGPSAKMEFKGQVNLDNHQVKGILLVKPNVTGGLPLAAAIAAGNPAVGAAIWALDKILGRPLKEISRYQYEVTGTWDKPSIHESSSLLRPVGSYASVDSLSFSKGVS